MGPPTPHPTAANASACDAWSSSVGALRHARHQARKQPGLAVCLTGQARLFMASFPALAHNLLLPAALHYRLDFFYVGPADRSFQHVGPWLETLPGLRSFTTYEPKLNWHKASRHPIVALNRSGTGRLAAANLNTHGLRCSSMPPSRLKSRLVQALQSLQCLHLVERSERAAGVAPFAAILRARVDLVVTAPMALPRLGAASRNDAPSIYSSLIDCPARGSAALAAHDFALFGERSAMGVLLGAPGQLQPRELTRHACDVGAASLAELRRAIPHAQCAVATAAANQRRRHDGLPIQSSHGDSVVAAVASVRGSVASRCFFIDQEHPPNDDQPQPQLARLFAGADDVASRCLGLAEGRDARRPTVRGEAAAVACAPRGGWDGDFREDASPWDAHGESNRGPGRR